MSHRVARLAELAERRPPQVGHSRFALGLDQVESGSGRLVERWTSEVPREGTKFSKGDVLFGKLRPYLAKAWVSDEPGVYVGDFICLRPSRATDPRFLSYLLRSREFIDRCTAEAHGSKMPRVEWSRVKSFPVPAPSPAEQRAIADYLDQETAEIDAFIADLERFRSLLIEEHEGQIAHDIKGLFWESRSTRLKRAADITVGIVVNPSHFYADVGVPALRGLNVEPGRIRMDDLVYLSETGHAQHSKSRLSPGDVVVVRTGQVGKAAVVPEELPDANAIDLLIVRPTASLDPSYLETLLNSHFVMEMIASQTVGAIQGHYNVESLRSLELPLPAREEQEALSVKWKSLKDNVDAALSDVASAIALAVERRAAIISAAVTGQIGVTSKMKPAAERLEHENRETR